MNTFPFLTTYDPPGSSEGTLDPLGLYMIADQLATRLVPAVRERMLRIRFLTAITVGALVTEDLEPNERYPDLSPFLVWEWLVVEAMVRTFPGDKDLWGLPGSFVAKKAVEEYGYVDQQSYLKTPRVFGFHGVYKRLAIHLGLVDSHLRFRSPHGEELVREWAKSQNLGRFDSANPLFLRWRKAVESSLREKPVRTRPRWKTDDWQTLAAAFAPKRGCFRAGERKTLRRLLHSNNDDRLGAFSDLWQIVEDANLSSDQLHERVLHQRLRARAPEYTVLLDAIGAYEAFCRNLSDGFDLLREGATGADAKGFALAALSGSVEFSRIADQAHRLFEGALRCLGEVDLGMEGRFQERFTRFSEPMPTDAFAATLCEHHEDVQQAKSREGKRPWFDRMGPDRIYMRQNFRVDQFTPMPDHYLHEYRKAPILRFYRDLQ